MSLRCRAFFMLAAAFVLTPTSCPLEAARAAEPAQPASLDQLRDLVDRTLDFTEHERTMSLEQNAAWQILHGVLAFGRDFDVTRNEVSHGDETVNVVDWVLAGRPMKGWTLQASDAGVQAILEPGKNGQGHEDQWLAILSQSEVDYSHPVVVDGQRYKIYDMIQRSMFDCWDGKEASWTLIALSQYLDPLDQTWQARDGQQWSLERLAGMEAGPLYDEAAWQDKIVGGACGGTHRLIGLTMALNRYRQAYPDRELGEGWQAAADRVAWAAMVARENQLPSGAFSISYFRRPVNSRNLDEHLAATGHTLELLSLTLTPQELRQPWVQRAVVYLCDLLERTRRLDLECGALYHAAHGLVLYRQRVWGPRENLELANKEAS